MTRLPESSIGIWGNFDRFTWHPVYFRRVSLYIPPPAGGTCRRSRACVSRMRMAREDGLHTAGQEQGGAAAVTGVVASDGVPWPERGVDLALTIILLPALALVAVAIAIAIYVDSPGPV